VRVRSAGQPTFATLPDELDNEYFSIQFDSPETFEGQGPKLFAQERYEADYDSDHREKGSQVAPSGEPPIGGGEYTRCEDRYDCRS
jgi:hypothetical protein